MYEEGRDEITHVVAKQEASFYSDRSGEKIWRYDFFFTLMFADIQCLKKIINIYHFIIW